jgi:hypothetical protein
MSDRMKQRGRLLLKHFDRQKRLLHEEIFYNAATDEGLNFIVDVAFGSASIFTWYMGLVDAAGFVSLDNDDTYLQLQADALNWDELDPENYNFFGNTQRRNINFDGPVAARIANDTNPVVFTIIAAGDGDSAQGIFVTSQSSVTQNSGFLFSHAEFSAPRLLSTDDELVITYEVTQARA